jgi:hypothetical protein
MPQRSGWGTGSVGSVEPDSVPGSGSRKVNDASEKLLRKKVHLLKNWMLSLMSPSGVWKSWRSKKKHSASILLELIRIRHFQQQKIRYGSGLS